MGKKILIVEDEINLAKIIQKKLQTEGFETIIVRSVEEAWVIVSQPGAIAVVWLDHYLLGTASGLDLVAKMKTDDSKLKNIPIFVVSNTASPDKIQAYINLGVNNYYTKANHSLEDIVTDIKAAIL
jgi:CheY-like chemotaxis protein